MNASFVSDQRSFNHYSFEWTSSSPKNEFDCLNSPSREGQCPPSWDNVLCWPPSNPSRVISVSCSTALQVMGVPTPDISSISNAKAFRICSHSGDWVWGNWTNYTQCMSVLEHGGEVKNPHIVAYILFIGSFMSLLLLVTSLFILFYFKSLDCPRIRVHRNLMISLVIHAISLVFLSSPHVIGGLFSSSIQVGWMCKTILCVKMYSSLSSINWMFIEGLMLHQRVTTKIFDQIFPFKVYYVIGWGIPMAVIGIWACLLSRVLTGHCWEGYGDQYLVWIVIAPMMVALLVNCVFLINIIRVLTLKLKRNKVLKSSGTQPVEMSKIKAVKATLLLFPLLGTTHLLFLVNPKNSRFEVYYMHFNAWLQSSQGVFVSILYCFMSSDVRRVLKNIYHRRSTRRGLGLLTKTSFRSNDNRLKKCKVDRKGGSEGGYNSFELNGFKTGNSNSKKSNSFGGQNESAMDSVSLLLPIHRSCCVSINDLQIKTTIINSNPEEEKEENQVDEEDDT